MVPEGTHIPRIVSGVQSIEGATGHLLRGDLPTAGLASRGSPVRPASGATPQTAARGYPTRVAVIRTVSKFMTNEPP